MYLPFVLLFAALMPTAHAEIYKCTDEHGNVAYLQTPCPVKKLEETAVIEDAEEPEYVPESTPEPQPAEARTPSSRLPNEALDDCKKRYRDQIDEIDAELGVSLSPAQAEVYKQSLLSLTRQLRACGLTSGRAPPQP